MRILITGAGGYVGSAVVRSLSTEHDVVPMTRKECDILDTDSVNQFFQNNQPFDFVIHCAITGGSREKMDDAIVTHNNLLMFNNLMSWKGVGFTSIINIGSGAEYDRRYPMNQYQIENNNRVPVDPYGMSKFYINQFIQNTSNTYNLRIFAIFDENELERRFIKSCLTNYIRGNPMRMYRDAEMDFIYMEDFISMVKMVLYGNIPSDVKSFDCVYTGQHMFGTTWDFDNLLGSARTLGRIAHFFINQSLDSTPVPIEHVEEFKPSFNQSYLGVPPIWMDQSGFVGLRDGIRRTYHILKSGEFNK
jgi:nucleoside-diphosphate-sugar epimerase